MGKKAKNFIKKLINLIPTKLPVGKMEFDKYVDTLFEAHGIPDLPSYRQAVATMILHLSPTTDKKPKYYFVRAIRKAQANEVAFHIVQELKKAEKELLASPNEAQKAIEQPEVV